MRGAAGRRRPEAELDFSGHVLDRVHLHECDYNWKTFIEVYLEDYHVGPFHPGLGDFVSCDDLRWEMGPHHSVQTVGVPHGRARPPVRPSTAGGRMPCWPTSRAGRRAHGAIWLTLYPNVMVEWYPNVLVVSTLFPQGPQKTLNLVEFFYPEEIVAFEREYVEAQQAAYMETCVEDDEIALRMDAGRRALLERGDDEAGPLPEPDGRRHAALPRVVPARDRAPLTAVGRPRPSVTAPLLMVLASLLFATMGVCVKLASALYGAGEIVFYRGLVGMLFIGAARTRARRHPAQPPCRRCTSGAACAACSR